MVAGRESKFLVLENPWGFFLPSLGWLTMIFIQIEFFALILNLSQEKQEEFKMKIKNRKSKDRTYS